MAQYRDKVTGNTLTVTNKTVSAMMEKSPDRYERLGEDPAATAKKINRRTRK